MSDCVKISCGTGRHCPQCKYLEQFLNFQTRPAFTKNALGRCDFYSAAKFKTDN